MCSIVSGLGKLTLHIGTASTPPATATEDCSAIDRLVLGRVDALAGVGREHEIPAIAHPLGVDLGDVLVFPLEISRPHEQVDLGVDRRGHRDLPHRSVFPLGWDGNDEEGDERGAFYGRKQRQLPETQVGVAGHIVGRLEPEDQDPTWPGSDPLKRTISSSCEEDASFDIED